MTCLIRSPVRSVSSERTFDALVQLANSIAVESLLGDFQLGRRKKLWGQFFDGESEYTPRGVVASLIASAQVVEMRCGYKNQITAALAKAKRLGVPFDLNEKQDYSAVVFLATQILTRLGKDGVGPWCKEKAPNVVKFLQEP
jgi:hypothetical protein